MTTQVVAALFRWRAASTGFGWLPALAGCLSMTLMFAAPTERPKVAFDVAAATADVSLKRFSEQSGLEVLFPTHIARDVRTQEVKGEMAPLEALHRMLADTGLVVIQDPKTQAFSIRRVSDTQKKKALKPLRAPKAGRLTSRLCLHRKILHPNL